MTVAPLYLSFIGDKKRSKDKTLISFERNIIRPVNTPASGTFHSERKEKASEAATNFSVLKTKKLDNHDTSLRHCT